MSTTIEIERMMEAKGLPESDRDEVRRLNEFLTGRKTKAPITPEMRKWLLGQEVEPSRQPNENQGGANG